MSISEPQRFRLGSACAPKGDSDELRDVFALVQPSAYVHAGESDPKAHCATDVEPTGTTERYAWQYVGLLKGLVRVSGRFYGIIGAITIIATIVKLEDITLELGHHTPPLDSIPKHRPNDDPIRLALYDATMTAISQLSETSERVCYEYARSTTCITARIAPQSLRGRNCAQTMGVIQ